MRYTDTLSLTQAAEYSRKSMEEHEQVTLFREKNDSDSTTKVGDDDGASKAKDFIVDELLQPIRDAASTGQKVEALKELEKSISALSRDTREKVAETLLSSTSCPTTTSPVFHAIQDCLISCGYSVVISTAVRVSRKLAAASIQRESNSAAIENFDPIITLDLCLTVFRRLVLSRDDDDDDDNNNNIENHLADLLLVQENWSSKNHRDNDHLPAQHEYSITMAIERWVQMLLLIPNTVANACQALRVPLPAWAAPSRYNARLVRLAAESAAKSDKKKNHLPKQNVDDEDKNNNSMMMMMYFHTLVRHMLRRPGGEDQVALALYQMSADLQEKKETDETTTITTTTTTTTTTCLSLLRSLVPRESARLSRAMLRLVLSKSTSTSRSTTSVPKITSTESGPRWRNAWLESTIRQLWKGSDSDSKDHADAFVRLAVFSLSSVSAAATTATRQMDWEFCYAVASLLACMECDSDCEGSAAIATNRRGSDTDSSDDDNDDDDDELVNENIPSSDRILFRYLLQAAQSWSQCGFLRQTEAHMQRHVTYFLRSGLSFVEKLDALSLLSELLLRGVEKRLGSTDVDVRKDGMYVGVLLARGLGAEVEFEELKHETVSTTKTNVTENTMDGLEMDPEIAKPGSNRQKKKRFVMKPLDPDAEFVTDDEEEINSEECDNDDDDDDSVWDDDSVLEPYNLYDDEDDLRPIPKPRYLTECLELLRTRETDENAASCHETALQEISTLVRSRPMDLPDFASELAMELLRSENKFFLENFQDLVVSSLCSLAVEEPDAVGTTLIEEMFHDRGLVDRLRVLETLSEAALELSGEKELRERVMTNPKTVPSSESPRGQERIMEADQAAEPLTQSLVSKAAQIQAVQTRRLGRGQARETEGLAIQNRFGPIAPGWFYLLLRRFIERRNSTKLWTGNTGATLLSRLFFTLATIVECCGNTAGADMLAKDLIQLVWSFRGADVAEVRVSVLFGVASCFPLLRNDVALNMILDDSPGSIGRDLSLIAENDPDEMCRQVAASVSRGVSSVAESSIGSQGSLLL